MDFLKTIIIIIIIIIIILIIIIIIINLAYFLRYKNLAAFRFISFLLQFRISWKLLH